MNQRFTEYTLPAHWAPYLINNDPSSFSLNDDGGDAEIALIDGLLENEGLGHCVGCGDEPEFRKWHDATAYGALAGDVLDFTFELIEETV